MATGTITLLDYEQVIQHSFEESQNALRITGNISVAAATGTQSVTGDVSVNNFPANQTVTVSNFPTTQPISGTVAVSNLPSTQAVSGIINVGNFPTTQAVSGSISIAGTSAVTGSVSVSNFPSTQAVSGSVSLLGTSAVSGSISVSNLPSTQAVSGSISVINFPATQAVSGSILVNGGSVFSNFNIDSATINGSGGSFTQIVASTSKAMTQVAVYDTTGSNLQILTGAAASEVTAIYLGPGDSGIYPLIIPAGTRLTIRSLDATAPSTGANIIVRLIG